MIKTGQQNRFIYNWWRSIDRTTFLFVFILIIIGGLISFAATPAVAQRYNLEPYYFVQKNLFFIPLSFLFIFFTSFLSNKGIKRFFLFFFFTSIIFIFFSFSFGIEVKGSNRWVSFLGYRFQPSEFLKVSFIIISAWIFSNKNIFAGIDNKIVSFFIYLFVSFLILLQPDFSMFFIISVIYFAQLWISGLKWKWVIVAGSFFLSVITISYFIFSNVQRRIDIFLDPSKGDNYQINKSLQAIIEGGFFGKGPGLGTIKDTLPDPHTDFIFAVIAEEFGWIACLFIIFIFIILIFRIFQRLKEETDIFIILAVSGLIIQFGIQIFVNLGSTVGLIPTTGVTLPFISYGGSSVLSMALNFGAILSLTRRKYANAF